MIWWFLFCVTFRGFPFTFQVSLNIIAPSKVSIPPPCVRHPVASHWPFSLLLMSGLCPRGPSFGPGNSLSPKELTMYLEGGGWEGLDTWEQASRVKEPLHRPFPLCGRLRCSFSIRDPQLPNPSWGITFARQPLLLWPSNCTFKSHRKDYHRPLPHCAGSPPFPLHICVPPLSSCVPREADL